ncbi:hypothetical protein [Microbulbifer celer]|uniref:DUF3325 domain-containing protein n=1 Tax=Microbulbifer celer TaxID=435905 RepID=A0ABW3U7G5_9GAMM|nr:hypothetical protein [Microbulbifer celer]UFN57044.1 hypothetical protein LPW13_15980 [Microbulbifer celer]
MEIQLLKGLAGALIFGGCLLTYLASSRQRLLAKPFARKPAWGLFAAVQMLAWVILAGIYPPFSAALLVLTLVMSVWIGLVLVSAHMTGRPLLVGSMGLVLFSLIMVTG